MVEVNAQLNVEVTYDTEATSLKQIKVAVRNALEVIASCEMVEVCYAQPSCDDDKLPKRDLDALE